jgi:hypothetical protein
MTIFRTGAAALALAAAAGAASAQCTIYRLAMPDFDQKRAAFPNDGKMYCVPTATANALAYISNHGFPATFGGPKDWSRTDAAMYGYTTERIQILATLMGTSATKGTGGAGWNAGTKFYLHVLQGQGNLLLFSAHASGFVGVDPHKMSDMMKAGGVVMPIIGWYEQPTPGTWQRTGGHLVTMWGGFNICSGDMIVTYCDPGNDDLLMSQGPFASSASSLHATTAFFKRKGDPFALPRTQWKFDLYSDGFLDGFYAIWPMFGLTTGATLQDITFSFPKSPSSDPPPPKIKLKPPVDKPIIGLAQAAIPTAAYVLTAAEGRIEPGKLWLVDFADETVEELATLLTPRAMETGRDGTVFITDGTSLRRFAHTGGGEFGQLGSVLLPAPAHALYYDDATDELLALSTSDRRLMRIGPDLDLLRNDALPAAIVLAADGSVTVNPVDGAEWIAGPGSASLWKLRREPVGGRIEIETAVTLPGVVEPRSLQFDERGNLALVDRGVIKEFEPDGGGGWRRLAGLFDGSPSGPLFRMGRSRSNWDPATMAGADDINILPPDTGPGTPHCVADMNVDGVLDFFDFLEFQDLFAAGSTHADLTADGVLDFFDFLAFQDAFAAGC